MLQRTRNQVATVYRLLNRVRQLPVYFQQLVSLYLRCEIHTLVKHCRWQDYARRLQTISTVLGLGRELAHLDQWLSIFGRLADVLFLLVSLRYQRQKVLVVVLLLHHMLLFLSLVLIRKYLFLLCINDAAIDKIYRIIPSHPLALDLRHLRNLLVLSPVDVIFLLLNHAETPLDAVCA